MKADDLMVGDIVLRKGKPVEIVSTSGIEYSFGQQDITIYQGKVIESMKFNRKELRKMFHAVTHGGAIVFQSHFNAEYDNGETEEFVRNVYINRPSILRKMIAANRRFRFKYDIVPHFDPKDKIILSEFGIDL